MAKRVHTEDQVTAFMRELEKQTDRGVGIVAASVIENALEEVIKRRLVPMSNTRAELLFGRMRPLSSFAAKIEVGAALGLYEERTRAILNMVRDVRNLFAHKMNKTSFDDTEIAKLVNKAQTPSLRKGTPTRDAFTGLFYAALALLYAIAPADIRIRPLSKTHGEMFLGIADALVAFAQRQAADREPRERPRGEPKPGTP